MAQTTINMTYTTTFLLALFDPITGINPDTITTYEDLALAESQLEIKKSMDSQG